MPHATCLLRLAALAALTGLAVASGHAAQAQTMPAATLGIWAPADAVCDLPGPEAEGEFPYLIVTRDGYAGHEATCRLTAVTPAPRSARQAIHTLSFTCEGEGMTWSVTERWATSVLTRRVGGWALRQDRLAREGDTYKRCPVTAAPSRD